jgi:hypothetical protein
MALVAPLWTQDTLYPARLDRQVSATMPPGVGGRDLLRVTQRQSGTNFSVDISAGDCIIPGIDQTNYMCRSTAIENRSIAAAPAPGTSRVDLVYAQVTDPQANGQAGTALWEIKVGTGTAVASNPQPPATPSFAIPLAQVKVLPTDVAVVDGVITDVRTASFRGGRGVIGVCTNPSDNASSSTGGGQIASATLIVGPGPRLVRMGVGGTTQRTSQTGLTRIEARIDAASTGCGAQIRAEQVGGPSNQTIGNTRLVNLKSGLRTLTLHLSNPTGAGTASALAGCWAICEDVGPRDALLADPQ